MNLKKLVKSKRGISEVITIILVILISVILIATFLAYGKNITKKSLDTSSNASRAFTKGSELDCANSNLKVESCSINTGTKEFSINLINSTSLDYGGFTLSVKSKTFTGEDITYVGYFDDVVKRGEFKELNTTLDSFDVIKENYVVASLDFDQIESMILTNKTCPNQAISLSGCSGEVPVVSYPIFSLTEDNYYESQDLVLSSPDGATIYYTTDGSTPTTESSVYSGDLISLPEDSTTTIKTIAVKPGYAPSPVYTATYVVTHQLSTPVASLEAGAFTTAQSVTLSSTTSGSTIYYTTDGSTPTTGSSVYSSPISIGSTTTLKAIATKSGYTNSSVYTGTYTITPLSIGMSYQGGIIAYILQSGDAGYNAGVQHGLIAPTSDQTQSPWGCSGTALSGADGTAIGTGQQNTTDILNGCATAGIAARTCDNLSLNGYTDWYLPSLYEFRQFYLNRAAIGGFTNLGYYATSSEYSNLYHYNWVFYADEINFYNKIENMRIRCVRSF